MELGARDLRGEEILTEQIRGLVSVDDGARHVDEHEVVVGRLRSDGPPGFKGAGDVRIDRHRPRPSCLLAIHVDDPVPEVETAPGERRYLFELLVDVLDGFVYGFDPTPERLLSAPARARQEAVEHTASKIDESLALLVDRDAADQRRVLVRIEILERDLSLTVGIAFAGIGLRVTSFAGYSASCITRRITCATCRRVADRSLRGISRITCS